MEDSEHESSLMKDNVLFFSKDNIDNSSASPTLLSGKEYLYQQYQQWGTNNKKQFLGKRQCWARADVVKVVFNKKHILSVFLLSVRLPKRNGKSRICIPCGENPRQSG